MDNNVNPNTEQKEVKHDVPNNNGKKSNVGVIILLIIISLGIFVDNTLLSY